MKKYFIGLLMLFCLFGCTSVMENLIGVEKTPYSRLEQPFKVEATRNYLPKDSILQPAYTIYEGSVWACNYKTEAGDFICCFEGTVAMGQWKYCLLVDEYQNGFAFMELGTNESLKWSEGKQPLFKKREGQ